MKNHHSFATDYDQCLHCKGLLPSAGIDFCCKACQMLYNLDKVSAAPLQNNISFNKSLKKFSYLDQNQFKKCYVLPESKMLFYIEGLSCSSCIHLLERLPEFNQDVLEARIHFGDATLLVHLKPEASWAHLAATIEELGYTPFPLSPGEDPATLYKKENRDLLKRIAVAGACAGNMMLFVIPVYAGLAGPWGIVFNWISFLLFLPILLYSAKPFYHGAWNFLKYRSVNVDLPIVVAFVSGFALSTYNLIHGQGAVYFDSTASFLFLILASRYFQKRFQQKYLGVTSYRQIASPQTDIGDILEIHQGQQIPVDGKLLSSSAEIDLSLFNGESLPQIYHKNMHLYAGTTLLSKSAKIRVSQKGVDTRLGRLMSTLRTEAVRKAAFIGLTDKLAQGLILFVFSLALGYFLLNFEKNSSEALHRSLALIVVACPCALAFGTPLAYGLALKKAYSRGIIIKNVDVFERALKIKNIFFDKTGTLTEGHLTYQGTLGEELSLEDKKIILSLESLSYHPLAFALRRAWSHISDLPAMTKHEEHLGHGVQGIYKNHHYSLSASKTDYEKGQLMLEFRKNDEVTHRLLFQDRMREDAKDVVEKISKKYHVELLSGDKIRLTEKMALLCEIPLTQCHGELSPEQKLKFIRENPLSCMVGDGANDSLALQAADIGIAVKGSTGLSLSSADVYFSRGGLQPLLELFSIAEQARKTIYRNLTISFIYNLIGGTLALNGSINPMIAAILMPISSICILLSSIGGTR